MFHQDSSGSKEILHSISKWTCCVRVAGNPGSRPNSTIEFKLFQFHLYPKQLRPVIVQLYNQNIIQFEQFLIVRVHEENKNSSDLASRPTKTPNCYSKDLENGKVGQRYISKYQKEMM